MSDQLRGDLIVFYIAWYIQILRFMRYPEKLRFPSGVVTGIKTGICPGSEKQRDERKFILTSRKESGK